MLFDIKTSLENNNISNSSSVKTAPVKHDLNTLWNQFCSSFVQSNGEGVAKNWIRPLSLSSVEIISENNALVKISAPSRFIKNWVSSNYINFFNKTFSRLLAKNCNVEIELIFSNTQNSSAQNLAFNFSTHDNVTRITPKQIQTISQNNFNTIEKNFLNSYEIENKSSVESFFDSNFEISINEMIEVAKGTDFAVKIDKRFSFENFALGGSNYFAHQTALEIASSYDEATALHDANPLTIHGPVGCGKTHLLFSICRKKLSENPYAKILYISADRFMFTYVKALREGNIIAFKQKLKEADLILFDDIQFICGKQNIQDEFCHILSFCVESGKQVVITCNRHPSSLENIDERLRSRILGGLLCDISIPEKDLKLQVIRKTLGARITVDAASFLAACVKGSIRELEGAIKKIIAVTPSDQVIDMVTARESTKDIIQVGTREIDSYTIKKFVADHFEILPEQLDISSRNKKTLTPRQVAMFLCRKYTTKSLPDIGKYFGGRDHATVIHSINKVKKMMTISQDFAARVEKICRNIESV